MLVLHATIEGKGRCWALLLAFVGRNSGTFAWGAVPLVFGSVVFKGIIVFEGTMVCMLGSVLYFRW
jgi:hypothetical protein